MLDLLPHDRELVIQVVQGLLLGIFKPLGIFRKYLHIALWKLDRRLVNGDLLTPPLLGIVGDFDARQGRSQTRHIALEANQLLLAFTEIGTKARVVDPHQLLTRMDHLALLDEDLLDDPPFQILYHLQLPRWDDLALTRRYFIELCPGGPDDGNHKKYKTAP